MADTPNFLIGYGERLTEQIQPVSSGGERQPPYSFPEARKRLLSMIRQASEEIASLPDLACPKGEAVAVLTLHPEYIAKSYFPIGFLRKAGFEPVGSRPRKIQPDKWSKKKDPEPTETTELFIAGQRKSFRNLAKELPAWVESTMGADDLAKIEGFRAITNKEKLMPMPADIGKEPLLEVILHASPLKESDYILDGFRVYLEQFNAEFDLDRRIYVGGLCFLPVHVHRDSIEDIAKFSFLRVARLMPKLRQLNPIIRSSSSEERVNYIIPNKHPINKELRAAVFDGGMPKIPQLRKWTSRRRPTNVGSPIPDYLEHGLGVTSALLFGSLKNNQQANIPYGYIDHFRVLDDRSIENPYELYDVLKRIQNILQRREYEFVNLSIGPELPIEDEEVHAWTAVLDDLLSNGDILATIAVGNGGERDTVLGLNRVQVPSDCVNALAVGAANSQNNSWQRASYSSIGPGRSPGIVKPDILAFGGSEEEPFYVVSPHGGNRAIPTQGTSYAAPLALRMGMGIRAHFGKVLTPLAIKTLLIHCSKDRGNDRRETGWGKIPDLLEEYVVCPEGTARIVYQGELSPAQYIRAQIPLPEEQLPGNVTIRVTFCYSTEIDPQDPGNYTRSGLDIVFRPNDEQFDENAVHPKSSPFFQLKEFSSEKELRHDAHKWETTLHQEKTKRGNTLKNPVFDIHYNARIGGAPSKTTNKIHYALVITVNSPKTSDIYDRILRRYRTQLRPLTPQVQIPVQAQR